MLMGEKLFFQVFAGGESDCEEHDPAEEQLEEGVSHGDRRAGEAEASRVVRTAGFGTMRSRRLTWSSGCGTAFDDGA